MEALILLRSGIGLRNTWKAYSYVDLHIPMTTKNYHPIFILKTIVLKTSYLKFFLSGIILHVGDAKL